MYTKSGMNARARAHNTSHEHYSKQQCAMSPRASEHYKLDIVERLDFGHLAVSVHTREAIKCR